jgi:hypothetical protein
MCTLLCTSQKQNMSKINKSKINCKKIQNFRYSFSDKCLLVNNLCLAEFWVSFLIMLSDNLIKFKMYNTHNVYHLTKVTTAWVVMMQMYTWSKSDNYSIAATWLTMIIRFYLFTEIVELRKCLLCDAWCPALCCQTRHVCLMLCSSTVCFMASKLPEEVTCLSHNEKIPYGILFYLQCCYSCASHTH